MSGPASSAGSTAGEFRDHEVAESFARARQLQEDGAFGEAVDEYQMVLAKEPQPKVMRALAECFEALEQPVLAEAQWREYTMQMPSDATALSRLGGLQVKLERYDEAVKTFGLLGRLDGDLGRQGLESAWMAQGESLLRRDRYLPAYRVFRQLLKKQGSSVRVLDAIRRALRGASTSPQIKANPSTHLKVFLALYHYGERQGLRVNVQLAFRRAGSPPALRDRVRQVLADKRVK